MIFGNDEFVLARVPADYFALLPRSNVGYSGNRWGRHLGWSCILFARIEN